MHDLQFSQLALSARLRTCARGLQHEDASVRALALRRLRDELAHAQEELHGALLSTDGSFDNAIAEIIFRVYPYILRHL